VQRQTRVARHGADQQMVRTERDRGFGQGVAQAELAAGGADGGEQFGAVGGQVGGAGARAGMGHFAARGHVEDAATHHAAEFDQLLHVAFEHALGHGGGGTRAGGGHGGHRPHRQRGRGRA
jgi:hypothetical protein